MSHYLGCTALLFSAWLGLTACAATSSPSTDAYLSFVHTFELSELADSFDPVQVESVLDGQMAAASAGDRRAAAVLIVAGLIDAGDLANEGIAIRKLNTVRAIGRRQHSALFGKVGDATLFRELGMPLNYEALLAADDVLEVLGDALAAGVITGYDLRSAGVYDDFPPGESFIYSHSEPVHLRQLTAMLAREGIDAWVHVTPKVSAFLHRAEWGPPGSNVATLANGARVVQGQEMAVLFQFGSADDRGRFHDLVTRYAKRDSDDEQGLIAGAWWQPFYYTDREFAGFRPISLVVLTAGEHEATLTVLPERAQPVIDAVTDFGWQIRHDQVWVNPAFYRFLEGGYK